METRRGREDPEATCTVDAQRRRVWSQGIRQRALRGEIENFTGVSDPYEPPLSPEVRVDLSAQSVLQARDQVIGCLWSSGWLAAPAQQEKSEEQLIARKLAMLGYTE